jgi:hypothetical protein
MRASNKVVVGLMLMAYAVPVWSQDLLSGVYEGERGSLKVIVDGNDVGVTVRKAGCLGSVEGFLARNGSGHLFIVSSSYQKDSCAIAIESFGKFSFSMTQGPECSYHHGASCSFNGFVERVQ